MLDTNTCNNLCTLYLDLNLYTEQISFHSKHTTEYNAIHNAIVTSYIRRFHLLLIRFPWSMSKRNTFPPINISSSLDKKHWMSYHQWSIYPHIPPYPLSPVNLSSLAQQVLKFLLENYYTTWRSTSNENHNYSYCYSEPWQTCFHIPIH